MLLQKQIHTTDPTAWLEQYAADHPSSPDPTQMLVLVAGDGAYDLRLISYEAERQQQRSRYYAKADAAILWSPGTATPRMVYKALLKSLCIDEGKLASAFGYASTHSMHTSQAWRKGKVFTKTLALANLFTSKPA